MKSVRIQSNHHYTDFSVWIGVEVRGKVGWLVFTNSRRNIAFAINTSIMSSITRNIKP